MEPLRKKMPLWSGSLAKENEKTVKQQVDIAKEQAGILENALSVHWPSGQEFETRANSVRRQSTARGNDEIERRCFISGQSTRNRSSESAK